MAVTTQTTAPYAPASAVIEVVKRFRNRGLSTPINAEVLGRAGVPASLGPRTVQALQTLDLIDEKGMPTPTLDGLRLAPETEFKQRVTEWLNAAYSDVLNFVDPATADETAVRDAFRMYNPVGQQPRMVSLFMGLYAYAGVITDKKEPAPRPGARVGTPAPKRSLPPTGGRASAANGTANRKFTGSAEMPPALAGLLASLPLDKGRWTQAERDKFVAVFSSVIDFCFPIIEPNNESGEPEE